MFGKDVIKQAVQVEPAASDEMTNALKQWMDAFAGSPGWLSRKHPRTINLASTSSLYLARLVNAELHFQVEGSERADFLQQQVDRYVLPQITARTEEAIAGGCIALKPYLYGGGIAVDFVRADRFYPLTIEPTGDVKEAVFVDQRSSGGYVYTRLERHYFVDGVYHIGNTAYKSRSAENLGTQISLSDFAPWAEIEPVVAIEGISGQLSQANEQIAGFKELNIEGVKQKAAEWEQKYNQAAQDSAREIEQLKFDFALDRELTKAQARNPKAVKALLDRDALKYDKGKIIGLEEQLETLKQAEDSKMLFGSAAPTVQFTTQSQSFQQMNDNDARAVMGLAPVK